MKKSTIAMGILSCALTCGAENINVSFAKNQWDQNNFMIVASPRFACTGSIIQEDDHIVNRVPENLSHAQLINCSDAYCALVYKDKLSGNITVSSKMSFDDKNAPLIVIAPELGTSADGKFPEFRDHYEIVLFGDGINVWHHRYRDGKPSWYKLAYIKCTFKPQTIYNLEVVVEHTFRGPVMVIRCDGNEFGCAFPVEFTAKEYFLGIIACEGINRFYDFKVVKNK